MQNFVVGHEVVPADVQDAPLAAYVKGQSTRTDVNNYGTPVGRNARRILIKEYRPTFILWINRLCFGGHGSKRRSQNGEIFQRVVAVSGGV